MKSPPNQEKLGLGVRLLSTTLVIVTCKTKVLRCHPSLC